MCSALFGWNCMVPLQAYPTMIPSTYFSENALLPGLVENKFYDEKSANRYYEELLDEMKKYDNSIPSTWLLAKFRQIGLDSYTHNFTLHSPLSKKEVNNCLHKKFINEYIISIQIYTGTNVYGILRAARASSTEAVVLSAPYRSSVSAHPPTAASIALMLAFAKYANSKFQFPNKFTTYLVKFYRGKVLGQRYNLSCDRTRPIGHSGVVGSIPWHHLWQ